MATVASSLKLFDDVGSSTALALRQPQTLVKPLGGGTSLIPPQTMADQERMKDNNRIIVNLLQVVNNDYKQINNTINETNQTISQTNHSMHLTNQTINQQAQSQDRFNDKIDKGKAKSEGLLGNMKKMAASLVSFDNVKQLFSSTIGGAAELSKQQMSLNVRAGGQSKQIYDDVVKESFGSLGGGDYKTALKGAESFLGSTKDSKQIVQLEQLSMRLQQFAPDQGFEGALSSMKDMMSGDFSSTAEKFHLDPQALENSDAKKAGAKGDVGGFIKGMDDLLNKRNMTEQALATMMDNPAQKWEKTVSRFQFNMASAGQLGLQAFQPLMDVISKAFDNGAFQPFFDGIAIGLKMIADIVSWAGSLILNNLDIVKAILLAVGVILLGMALEWIVMWLSATWPVLAVVAAIALLMTMLGELGVSFDQVVGFVSGLFSGLFAFLWNTIAFMYNPLIDFSEFMNNLFIDPVYAIQKLFYDLNKDIVQFFGSMINAVVGGIDWLIGKFNKITGMDISTVGKIDFEQNLGPKPTSSKGVMNFDKYRMKTMDIGDAVVGGYNKGAGAVNKAEDALKNFNAFGFNEDPLKIDKINKVDSVGNIDDKVDISSEDLKTMRELAEMKNIQNFVTLTPTVQITGDNHFNQESDIDTIINNITGAMVEHISSSAEGVYA